MFAGLRLPGSVFQGEPTRSLVDVNAKSGIVVGPVTSGFHSTFLTSVMERFWANSP